MKCCDVLLSEALCGVVECCDVKCCDVLLSVVLKGKLWLSVVKCSVAMCC